MNRIFLLTLPTLLAGVTCAAAVAHAVVITPDYLVPLAEEMRTNNPALRSAEALTQAAEAEVAAVRTWEDPNLVMGGVAGNLALTFGARGGVYVSGGIAPRIADRLAKGTFRARFEDKGRLSDYVKAIPTYLVVHPYPAIIGAARELGQMERL